MNPELIKLCAGKSVKLKILGSGHFPRSHGDNRIRPWEPVARTFLGTLFTFCAPRMGGHAPIGSWHHRRHRRRYWLLRFGRVLRISHGIWLTRINFIRKSCVMETHLILCRNSLGFSCSFCAAYAALTQQLRGQFRENSRVGFAHLAP